MIKVIAEHSNDPDYKNLQTQIRAVTTDYAQLVGRGKQTVHSDEEALGILNTKMNVASIKGFQDAVTAEKENLQKGIKDTEDDLFGDDEGGNAKPSGEKIQLKATHRYDPSSGKIEEIK